jgi:tripartite-type tricarboxylate transporter receptor subunit TctC
MNRESPRKWISGVFAGTLAGILLAGAAAAQTPSYEGKTLRMIIPSGAGGGYDTYARVLSAHLEKHLPGKPTIINQNMPGASG